MGDIGGLPLGLVGVALEDLPPGSAGEWLVLSPDVPLSVVDDVGVGVPEPGPELLGVALPWSKVKLGL